MVDMEFGDCSIGGKGSSTRGSASGGRGCSMNSFRRADIALTNEESPSSAR